MNQPTSNLSSNIYVSTALVILILAAAFQLAAQDRSNPVPKIDMSGPQLKFDFPEMLIGVAEYDEGPTGTTVFYFPDSVKAAVDVRGGAPGTLNAAGLLNPYDFKVIEAVVFSGGSAYGLSAATGAAYGIKDLRIAEGNPDYIAGVAGAIIYDVGGRRMTRVTPDDRLGREAVKSARAGWFPLGARGAGRFAMQGVYFNIPLDEESSATWPHSGQGGAFRQIGPTKIAVFTVVNALGAITDREGRVVRCSRNDPTKKCPLIADMLRKVGEREEARSKKTGLTSNTTVTLVVTNQKLPIASLQRLAKQVHGSMGRAIQPFATEQDGDVLYAVSTDQIENPELSALNLSVIASELAWDAVLSSVPELPPVPAPLKEPSAHGDLSGFAGDYEFTDFSKVGVRMKNGRLVVTYDGIFQFYFFEPEHRLIPAEDGSFIIDLPSRDAIRFEVSDGKVTGLILNPGPWAQRAIRTKD